MYYIIMLAEIIKLSVFVLNVAVAAFFLYLSVKHIGYNDTTGKIAVAAAAYSLLYNVYDMYKNTSELQRIGTFAGDVVEGTVDVVTGAVSHVKEGIDKTT